MHDESKYEIRRDLFINGHNLVWVYFPDCPYPDKIMIYENSSWLIMKSRKSISPHFKKNAPSPIARFEPTERGWYMGIKLMEILRS